MLLLCRNDVALLRNIYTVKELSDILVSDSANTLDRGGCRKYDNKDVLSEKRRKFITELIAYQIGKRFVHQCPQGSIHPSGLLTRKR